jgi:hypothetical protein
MIGSVGGFASLQLTFRSSRILGTRAYIRLLAHTKRHKTTLFGSAEKCGNPYKTSGFGRFWGSARIWKSISEAGTSTAPFRQVATALPERRGACSGLQRLRKRATQPQDPPKRGLHALGQSLECITGLTQTIAAKSLVN